MRALPLVGLLLFTGCYFEFNRGDDKKPGDIAGAAVRADGTGVAPYSRITVLGAQLVRVAAEDGSFVVGGLGAGAWVLRFSEDNDGDGVPDRAALRAAQLSLVTVGDEPPALDWVLLGDVPLESSARMAGRVARDDGANPTDKTQVFVFRNVDDFDDEELAGVGPEIMRSHDLEAEAQTGLAEDGTFTLEGVTPGRVRVVAFDPGDSVGGAFMSDTMVADVPSSVSEDDPPFDVGRLEMSAVTTDRRAVVDLVFDPPLLPGDEYDVTVVRAGAPRSDASQTILVERHDDADRVELQLDLGAYDVYVDSAPGARAFHGFLPSQLVHAGGDLEQPVVWGFMQLTPVDPCAGGPGTLDRDLDGLQGLPPRDEAPELWSACESACATASSADATPVSCAVGGETFDCDDDHDGQPDVLEPGCLGVCAGTDLDADGACDRGDPDVEPCFPNCEPIGDAGPPPDEDAGVSDAGRAGCSAATSIDATGAATGTLDGAADDVDACAALGAPDAVYGFDVTGRLSSLRVSTAGSAIDTVLSLFGDACTTAGRLACNDDAPGSPASTSLIEQTDLPAGGYHVVVEGWRGAEGDYQLSLEGTWAAGEPCDPAMTWLSCEVGTCEDVAGTSRCTPPRDCSQELDPFADGGVIDADDDQQGGEDAALCNAPPDVTCPASVQVDVLSPVTLTATATDNGSVQSVRWTLLDPPIGSAVALADANTLTTGFTPRLAGTYPVRFVAMDDEGQLSACTTTVEATTDDVFRVELLWNVEVQAEDTSDLDLHLLHPFGAGWFTEDDCHWNTCKDGVDWASLGAPDAGVADAGAADGGAATVDGGAGDAGTGDAGAPDGGPGDPLGDPRSPSLDDDDAEGRGPENINILAPEQDGPYRIGVHYHSDKGFGPSDAMVKIFCFGELVQTLGAPPDDVVTLRTRAPPDGGPGVNGLDNDFWRVADVSFSDTSCTVTPVVDVQGDPLIAPAADVVGVR